jgi:hypothetical protein
MPIGIGPALTATGQRADKIMFGFHKKAPTISLLDGPLCPNDKLEEAASIPLMDPDDICLAADGTLLVTSGKAILRLADWNSGKFEPVAEFDRSVTALDCRDDGTIAVALDQAGIKLVDSHGKIHTPWKSKTLSVNVGRAVRFSKEGSLFVADACRGQGQFPHLHDLFAESGSGRVLKLEDNGAGTVVAKGLRYPNGITEIDPDLLAVAESWSACLCRIACRTSQRSILIGELPGYPARIHPFADGFILTCFARRDPLIEFILTEKRYVARMTKELPPELWIAPRLSAQPDYRLPIQSGATRLFGALKPWAPSFSYGLVMILDPNFMPMASAQSRANGRRHGITAALEWRDDLIAVSKGSNELLKLSMKEL